MAKRRSRERPAAPASTSISTPQIDLWISLFLVAAIFAAYAQVLHFAFTNFDDPVYVTENPHVQAGLSFHNLIWAFTTSTGGSGFPLTWLSHMLDCQVFGLDSGWHHFTNVCIHALATIAWYAAIHRITGDRWKSALVAFLYARYPLHVESVAWVCERKDVLSALFCALTIWAYAAYVQKPSTGLYLLTLSMFTLGLLSKPMLVTLPVVFLLLDYWPLKRGLRIFEKLPFFLLSIADSVVTYFVHLEGKALPTFEQIPIATRIENALLSYALYLRDMIWPAHLAVFYPYSQDILAPAVIAALCLMAITFLAWRRPYLRVGWAWYLITLVPVIGLIQAGAQARADRFTYIPMIGISIAVIWGVGELPKTRPRLEFALAAAVCAACFALTCIQVSYWRDDVTLYRNAIEATKDNYVAHFNLARALSEQGDQSGASVELREAVRIKPLFADAHAELGQFVAKTDPPEALRELQTAIELKPASAGAHLRSGTVLARLGRLDEAEAEIFASHSA